MKRLGVQLLFSSERNHFTSLNLCLFLFIRSGVRIKFLCLQLFRLPSRKIIAHGMNSIVQTTLSCYFCRNKSRQVCQLAAIYFFFLFAQRKHIVLYVRGWNCMERGSGRGPLILESGNVSKHQKRGARSEIIPVSGLLMSNQKFK